MQWTVQFVTDIVLPGWEITKNRSLNYKMCSLHLMKVNTSCFDKRSDGHAKLNSPPKHFSIVECHLCFSETVYKLCDMIKYIIKARKNETNFEVVYVTSRSLTEQTIFSPLPHPVAARLWDANGVKYCCGLCLCLQACKCFQQWQFCEHGQPQKTCHSHLKYALTHVL
jgi:hypothetical protein